MRAGFCGGLQIWIGIIHAGCVYINCFQSVALRHLAIRATSVFLLKSSADQIVYHALPSHHLKYLEQMKVVKIVDRLPGNGAEGKH